MTQWGNSLAPTEPAGSSAAIVGRPRSPAGPFALGVVAHADRAQQARRLADHVGAVHLSIDDGTLGPGGNHLKVWATLAHNTHTHAVVLEDDAEPVDGFRDQLAMALQSAPTAVVGLYLGTGRPPHWQTRISQAAATADREHAHWIVTVERLLYGVGIAIRTDLVPSMIAAVETSRLPYDQAIADWALGHGHRISFTWPSLVDHLDNGTLIRHPDGAPRDTPRRAWRTGTRTHWTTKAVTI